MSALNGFVIYILDFSSNWERSEKRKNLCLHFRRQCLTLDIHETIQSKAIFCWHRGILRFVYTCGTLRKNQQFQSKWYYCMLMFCAQNYQKSDFHYKMRIKLMNYMLRFVVKDPVICSWRYIWCLLFITSQLVYAPNFFGQPGVKSKSIVFNKRKYVALNLM